MNAISEFKNSFALDQKYTLEEGSIYLNGTQALVRLMLDQKRLDRRNGLNTGGFVCGYPGSPVGNVDPEMIRNRAILQKHDVHHQQGLNEELAATAVFGTQTLHDIPGARYDGVYAMWFGKAPGVDRTGDAFHHHNFRGVGRNGGVLAVAGDDPHARSTIFPSDSNAAFYKFFMPILAPGNIQEVLDFGLHGYALSRACGLWVGFKLVTDVADSAASALVGPGRINPIIPEVMHDGAVMRPEMRTNQAGAPLIEAERKINQGQLEIARRYAALNGLNRIVIKPPKARFGILTSGKTYFDVRQALTDIGLDDAALHANGIAILKMGMIYPVEPEIVREFASGLEEILVVEDKRPFLELFLKDILYALPERPRVVGKMDDAGEALLPVQGELSADVIARAIARRFGTHFQAPAMERRIACLSRPRMTPLALSTARTPFFCSGCPHNRSLKVPDGSIVGAGIGCHIMALWMGPGYGEVKGYTQMGGEGAQWVGLAPFTDTRHFFQNLGDGTFSHSGSLALRFAASTKVNVTYKILYNSTVAMTGGQDIQGGKTVANMVKELEAEGVRKIIITTDEPERYPGGKVSTAEVWHRDRLLDAERLLAQTPGVTVLLNDQQCATEKRRLRKRGKMAVRPVSAFINERVCEGCGDCGRKSNCLSVQPVESEFGRKTQIHQSSCNQDLSCILGDCPSFATVESSGVGQKVPARKKASFPEEVLLSEPVMQVSPDRFSVCLMGIGGTGVVTVNQVLGTAAFMSGIKVQTYDHTGSSQKAGPVVSHLRIMPDGEEGSPTIPTAGADLYLVFDPLVAVNPANIALTSAERTIAVVSTAKVPTGEMVANKSKHYPALDELRGTIDATTRKEHNVYFDAQNVAERLLGDHMASNMMLVGAAYQVGALPIPAAAIEEAIRLNGTAVDMNLLAFRWGRLMIAEPARVDQAAYPERGSKVIAMPPPRPAVPADVRAMIASVDGPAKLLRVLERRVPELIAFQDAAYAERYLTIVREVRQAENQLSIDDPGLSIAVATNLYKLMAYKDEYEVARLLLDDAEAAKLRATFGADAKVYWHLHPTFLRRLGFRNKVRLGPWFKPALQALRWAKRLRGGALDVFGIGHVRRAERELIIHYTDLVHALCMKLTAAMVDDAVKIASLPDMIRGYENVKMENLSQYKAEVSRLAQELGIKVRFGEVLTALPVPMADAAIAMPEIKSLRRTV